MPLNSESRPDEGTSQHFQSEYSYQRSRSSSIPVEDLYGEYKSESQIYFSDQLGEARRWSLWMTFIFVLLMWNEFFFGVQFEPMYYHVVEVRCRVPALERTNWSYEEIAAVSQFRNKSGRCFYYDHDYGALKKLPYETALNITESFNKPKVLPCIEYVSNQKENSRSFMDEFHFYCDESEEKFIQLTSLGKVFGSLSCCFLADIYGRRTILLAILPLMIAGSMFKAVASNQVCIYVSTLLIQVTVYGSLCIANVLFLELIHHKVRMYMVAPMALGFSIGRFFHATFFSYFDNWRIYQWVVNCTFLMPVCLEWLVPESPRWLIYRKRWEDMVILLNGLSYSTTVTVNDNLFVDSQPPRPVAPLTVLRTLFKPAFLRKLLISVFFFSLYFYIFGSEMGRIIYITRSELFNAIVQGICIILNFALVPFLLKYFGRQMTLCTCFLVLALLYCGTTIIAPYSTVGCVVACICLTMAHCGNVVNSLVVAESFPTKIRSTALGFSVGIAMLMVILNSFFDVMTLLGKYGWSLYASLMLVAAFICVLLRDTEDVQLPDTELQALLTF